MELGDNILDTDLITGLATNLDIDSPKQYYLVQTLTREQIVGVIEEEKKFSCTCIRVDVPNKYGFGTEYSKYIKVSSIISMIPISEETAIEFVKTNVLEPIKTKATSYSLKEKKTFDKRMIISKIAISLISTIAVCVLITLSPMATKLIFPFSIVAVVLLLFAIIEVRKFDLFRINN